VLTYVTLKEDPILETRLDQETFLKYRPVKSAPAMLFIEDDLPIKSGKHSVKIQQVPRILWEQGDGKVPETRPGTIMATFSRPRQARGKSSRGANKLLNTAKRETKRAVSQMRSSSNSNGTPPMPQQSSAKTRSVSETPSSRDEPSSPSPQIVEVTDTPSKDPIGPEPATPQPEAPMLLEPAPPSLTICGVKHEDATDVNIDLLVAIWKDEGLGLYNTKWPVLTHLAHLAAKRAIVHLRENNWQHASEGVIEPFTLPNVHENVRDTLYYL
jgi:hypothetical protein